MTMTKTLTLPQTSAKRDYPEPPEQSPEASGQSPEASGQSPELPEQSPELPEQSPERCYEYLHPACQGVAFVTGRRPATGQNFLAMVAPRGQSFITCEHCGMRLVQLSERHLRVRRDV